MSKNMNVQDARLRLEQLKEGHLPPKEMPMLANPLYVKAYANFMRYGTPCGTLREGTDSAGGFLVPDEFEKKIVSALGEKNVLRGLARVITTHNTVKIAKAVGAGHAYWVPEEGPYPETSTAFDQIVLGAHKLGTMVCVSDELLEDSAFDIEEFIAKSFAERLATTEEDGFLYGDGNSKPLGLMHQIEKTIITENAGEITPGDLVDLQHSIPTQYRDNVVFLMSDATFRDLYKTKSAFERNIWEGDYTKARPLKLLGRRVIICNAMDAAGDDLPKILYGDFSQYVIGDREHRSVKRLNEIYARHGMVGFMVTQRVDAVLMDKKAIAGLKMR